MKKALVVNALGTEKGPYRTMLPVLFWHKCVGCQNKVRFERMWYACPDKHWLYYCCTDCATTRDEAATVLRHGMRKPMPAPTPSPPPPPTPNMVWKHL